MYLEETYYAENRERILAKARSKIQCPCGAIIAYANRSSHRRTIAHVIWEKSQRSDALRRDLNNVVQE